MEELREILQREACSCVIRKHGEIRIFRGKGVKDLYELYRQDPTFLNGAAIADKVVGKAAAALMILGGITSIYATIISTPALTLLKEKNIEVSYEKEVPYIINRAKDGWCPLEIATYPLNSLDDMLSSIVSFFQNLSIHNTH